jgi:hypothetical protein
VAKFTLTIEDLPEGDKDLILIQMDTAEKSESEEPTPAEYITCLLLEIVDKIQKGAAIDSLSEVQN